MARPKIVADENIPYVREAFGELGEVHTVAGRKMTPQIARDADILLVRSVTHVDAALLSGSPVRFVGTATIGEDHIDKEYLARENIRFDSAPGSNADSVADYVTAALLALSAEYGLDLAKLKLGVVGVGNVGSRVALRGEALGMTSVLNDPPLARLTGDAVYRPIDEIHDCDIVTFHVPLTDSGPDATRKLADARFFSALKPGSIFINTARGPVQDEAAIHANLDSGHLRAVVLDVWDGEPDVDITLLNKAFIATPHIAGYSFDGKVNGTVMLYQAVTRFLGKEASWDPAPLLPPPECPTVHIGGGPPLTEVRKAVETVYPVRQDDAAMRAMKDCAESERVAYFDRLRKEYPRRREFARTTAVIDPPDDALRAMLRGLTFQVDTDN